MKYCGSCGNSVPDEMLFCNKCGTKLDSTSISQSHNYSNVPVDRPEATLMADRLKAAIPYVEEAVKIGERIDQDEKWIEAVRQGRFGHSFFKHYAGFLFGGIGVGFMGLILSVSRNTQSFGSFLSFVGLSLIIGGIFVARKWVDSKNESLKQMAINKEKTVNENYKLLDQVLFSKSTIMQTLRMFPDRYWYPFALQKMAEYFVNRRVDSIKEAINLFEEESHRMRLENYANQQAVQLNSIRRSAAISAGANVANAVNNIMRR
jgi:hypothetical protein